MSEFWENLDNQDEALDAILTGYKGSVENMPVYESVIKYLKKEGSILDFGCGAGRNLAYLKDHYTRVYGYDYPNMLKFVSRETSSAKNVHISSNLDYVCSLKYDEILFSLVLQHIHPDEMRALLTRLTSRASRFIIHSRIWVDFTEEDIMPILEEFFTIESIEYNKDPNSDRNDHFIGLFLPK